jgi:Methyltransferase domain.
MIGFHHYIYNMDVRSDMAELVLNYLPQGGVAADLGCGAGRFCKVLLNKASKVYCVDINDYAINMAKKILRMKELYF